MNVRKETLEHWTVTDSADIYGIRNWGAGYFDISEAGEVVTTPFAKDGGPSVSLMDIIRGIKERGMGLPVLLRIGNILDSQLTLLHESFRQAIAQVGYKAPYKGVYPIKVNQQQQVLEEITRFGANYHHGLEAGSKAELKGLERQLGEARREAETSHRAADALATEAEVVLLDRGRLTGQGPAAAILAAERRRLLDRLSQMTG